MSNAAVKRKINFKRKKRGLWLHAPKRAKINLIFEENQTTPDTHSRQLTSEIVKAPIKRQNGSAWNTRRRLFPPTYEENTQDEILLLIPSVLKNLNKEGLREDFCLLLKGISSGKFPVHNIAFRLLLDVAKWYSLKSTTQMEYGCDSMKFWKVVYRLFHGKTLRFMSGAKSVGQVIDGSSSKGLYDPQTTKINFAVPNINSINNFDLVETHIPREINPGVIVQALEFMPRDKNYVLSVDGKKLAPGLTNTHGDQDLFGHEEGNSLQDLKDRLEAEIQEVETVKQEWNKMNDTDKKDKLINIVSIVSIRIKELRLLFQNQTFALRKFYKEAGDDWRTSRFVYAISSVQAVIYQIKSIVRRLLQTNKMIFECVARINNSSMSFVCGTEVDQYSQANWISLKDTEDLPEGFLSDTRYVKQRSLEWFEKRKQFRLTGSKLYEGLGLDSLKNLHKHYDKVIRKKNLEETVSNEVQEKMDHGTKSEIHAIATLATQILPVYYPSMSYIEEGAFIIHNNEQPFIMVSPDGNIGRQDLGSTYESPTPILTCEFKCPFPNENTVPVHYDIPLRYIPQILGEMASTHTYHIIYLSWSAESSTVFRAKFDEDLWEMMMNEAIALYGQTIPKRPTRVSENAKEIRQRMVTYRKTCVEFLCEIPSIKCTSKGISQTTTETPYVFPLPVQRENEDTESNIEKVLTESVFNIKESYQICRRKASEVLVWLLSDSDRQWHPDMPNSVPIAYAMKGYSLSTNIMRSMHDNILEVCSSYGINVICSCFDGQWVKLGTRNGKNKPMTLLQLQKDVWEKAKKTSRENILNAFVSIPVVRKVETDLVSMKSNFGSLSVSCPLYAKLINAFRNQTHISQTYPSHCEIGDSSDNIEEVTDDGKIDAFSSLPDDALDIINDNESFSTAFITDIMGTSETREGTSITQVEHQPVTVESSTLHLINNEQEIELNNEIYQKIWDDLKDHQKSSIQKKWKDKCSTDLKTAVKDTHGLRKLTHDELNVIIEHTHAMQKQTGIVIKKSWAIKEKSNAISKLIGNGVQIVSEKTVKHLLKLTEFASRALKSYSRANSKTVPKQTLNVIYATLIFPREQQQWYDDAPFSQKLNIEGVGSTEIFSYPNYNSKTENFEPMCVDAHHLLVNLRVKVCKDGVKGIKKDAWHAVAQNRDIISKSLVVDLVDKQNNAYALKTFSIEVENEMHNLGYTNEADFCSIVRNWYEAEDSPGISAVNRANMRLRMKQFLLSDVDFGTFPPYGMFIKGFSRISFEGFLQKIDTNIQLYALTNTGTYNQRSISSLANETFFVELIQMETTRLGCPKAVSIPRLMSTITEILHCRSDPSDRSFSITSARKSVYPVPPLLQGSGTNECLQNTPPSDSIEYESGRIQNIPLKNHFFDSSLRRRKKQRQAKKSDISKPQEVTRGCLPIRQYHKCDESKILPTTRLGIDLS